MRLQSTMIFCSALCVDARLDIGIVMRALRWRHSGGVYVNHEGPLNILRGHPMLNNDMVAKKRKFSALVRTQYRYTYDKSELRWACTGDARNDGIRELDSNTAAMLYLREYYTALEAMFTVVDGAVVINGGSRGPFPHRLTPEERSKLYAVLLVLAGGGDVDFSAEPCMSGGCAQQHKVTFLLAATKEVLLELDFDTAEDDGVLAVLRFLSNYGGKNVSKVEACGLHYTDTPSFLIQAYISESIGSKEDAVGLFRAAREIVAKLCDGDTNAPLWQRFFTTDRMLARNYAPGYAAVSEICRNAASLRSTFSQHVPPQRGHCVGLRAVERLGDYVPIYVNWYSLPDLLKLCCFLCYDPTTGSCSAERIGRTGASLSKEFIEVVCKPPELLIDDLKTYSAWDRVTGTLREEATNEPPQGADLIRFDKDGCELESDVGNYMMVLAKLFGFSADDTKQLCDQLTSAVNSPDSISSDGALDACIRVLLDKHSLMRVSSVACTGIEVRDKKLYGSLRLEFGSRHSAGAPCLFHIELLFKEEFMEIHYSPKPFALSDEMRASFAAVIEKLPAGEESSLSALLRGCIERFLSAGAGSILPDPSAVDALVSDDPLASYVALNEWMERRPMQCLRDVLAAADQLLPSLEKQLGKIRKCDTAEREEQLERFASSPFVAVIDNIIGNADLGDDAVREPLLNILRHCVDGRARLFPSICLPDGSYPRMYKRLYGCDSESPLACLADYDVPNMLLGQLKLRSTAGLSAEQLAEFCERSTEFVAKPWRDLVHPVLATFFRLGHAEGIEFVREHCLPGLGDTSEDGYCRMAFWISLSSCASPAVYQNAIREVCGLWADPLCELPGSVLAYLALQRNCKPEPLSVALVGKVFPDGPTVEQLKILVRIFEIYAATDSDYDGIREVMDKHFGVANDVAHDGLAVFDDYIREKTDKLIKCYDDHCSDLIRMKQCQSLQAVMSTHSLGHYLAYLSRRVRDNTILFKYWRKIAEIDRMRKRDSNSAHPPENRI
ncbi:hypothetical protein PAPHI01_0465 [Pancytospora philotis]|nr:hypothetical protein PAPHI01_0465 [Pancytospora philotis]